MKITRNKSGSYKIDYRINNKRIRESYPSLQLCTLRIQEIESGNVIKPRIKRTIQKLVSLEDCFSSWHKWSITNSRLAESTQQLCKICHSTLFSWLKDNNIIYVDDINKSIFDRYVQCRKKQGVGLATIKKEYNFLSAALNFCVSRDIIVNNSLTGFWKGIKIQANAPEVPEVEDIQKIFDNLPDTDTRKAFYCILAHGCRFSEFATLHNSDIQNDIIRFWRVQKGGYERNCPLTKLPFKINSNGLAFSFHGKIWKKENLCRRIKKACRSAGVPEIVTHTLRHAHATYSLANGDNIYNLMQRCGWRSLQMVQRYVTISARYTNSINKSFLPKWVD